MRTPACPQRQGCPQTARATTLRTHERGHASEYHVIKFLEGHAASCRVGLPNERESRHKDVWEMLGGTLIQLAAASSWKPRLHASLESPTCVDAVVALRRVWTIHTRQIQLATKRTSTPRSWQAGPKRLGRTCRHGPVRWVSRKAMYAEALFAEELAAKAAAAGAEVSPWACTLDKSYSCDQYLGPPTREFGALSPSSNRLVAWAV